MSLERYRRARLVVLPPSASVHAAARAMMDNHVGAILVAERGKLVGVVTDRDLALEVVGSKRPVMTPLHEVMSEEIATVQVTATIAEVVETMRTRACRRIPIMEDGK